MRGEFFQTDGPRRGAQSGRLGGFPRPSHGMSGGSLSQPEWNGKRAKEGQKIDLAVVKE